MKTDQRNSAFEIMRLIAMFMVILGHCVLVSAQDTEPYLGALDCIGWGIKAFTVCAVNLFFLLSGFYLRSDGFRISRVAEIWLKTIFYSGIIYIIVAIATSSFSVKECVKYLMPVLNKKYWYIQTYVAVALVAPIIGIALEKLNNRRLTFLVAVLLLFFSLHETFIKVEYTLDKTQGYGFIWACVMLVIGHWLRRNIDTINRLPIWIFFVSYIFISIAIFISNYLIVKYDIAAGVTSRGNFYAYNSVSVFLQSISLFCVFIKLSTKDVIKPSINYLGRNTLAGYLISAHPLLLAPLWTDWIKMGRYAQRPAMYVFLSFVFSVVTLVVCIFIDKIMDKTAEKCGMRSAIKKLDAVYEAMVGS